MPFKRNLKRLLSIVFGPILATACAASTPFYVDEPVLVQPIGKPLTADVEKYLEQKWCEIQHCFEERCSLNNKFNYYDSALELRKIRGTIWSVRTNRGVFFSREGLNVQIVRDQDLVLVTSLTRDKFDKNGKAIEEWHRVWYQIILPNRLMSSYDEHFGYNQNKSRYGHAARDGRSRRLYEICK